MSISFIFAMDRNRAIGKDNQLPWHLPADLKFFKAATWGHPILMGRKTYQSIGKPLPGRRNVVITQDPTFTAEGCDIVHTLEEAAEQFCREELFVIGGAEIFRLFLPHADRMYITRIEHEFAADVFFPETNMEDWVLVSSEQGVQDEKNPYIYYFQIYERKQAKRMKYFAVLLPMKDQGLSTQYRSDHLAYLEDRRSEGKIFANGKFVDGSGGMVIYKAESFEEAQAIAENDPFVRLGARNYEIHEWDIVIS